MFTPVKQNNVTEGIVQQVEQAIVSHRLNPGDRLLTERGLHEIFEASRGAVREALSILRQKGLIEIRRGGKGGAYVKQVGVDQVSEGLAFLIKYRMADFQELAEFRVSLEGLAAGLAAERATPEDIGAMKSTLEEMTQYMEAGEARLDEFYGLEKKMHEFLATMSRNTLIQWTLMTLHMNMGGYTQLYFWDNNGAQQLCRDWSEIVKAIESREGVMVTALVKSHIVRSNQVLKEGAQRLGLTSKELGRLILKGSG
jgi:GntR family transcriptional regulator, transcriptional repressor for pyruvate dehydrogenase complex